MMFLIVLLLFTENIGVFAQYGPADSEFSRVVKNNVEKINANLSKTLINDLKPGENLIFSPINIYGALALTHLGATGKTKAELSNALGFPVEEEKSAETHGNLGKLFQTIQNPNYDSAKVNIANGIFIQRGLNLKDEYSKNTLDYYKSETGQLDFAKGGPNATNFVNNWIAEKTNDRIPKLFNEEISKDTAILLASTLYFAAKWSDSFDKKDTENKTFNTGVGQIKVPTMRINESVPYVDNEHLKFQAISIPYLYGEFSLLIVLPYREQSLRTLTNAFKPEQLSEIVASLKSTYVNYEIPRMKFRWSQDINAYLTKLGIKQMFDKAELGKMVDSTNIAVSKVTHAAEIEVNEEGTVASAVTALQIVLMSLPYYPNPPIPFHADRPFLFSIYHRNTGVILFSGAVQNPTVGNE